MSGSTHVTSGCCALGHWGARVVSESVAHLRCLLLHWEVGLGAGSRSVLDDRLELALGRPGDTLVGEAQAELGAALLVVATLRTESLATTVY